MGILYTHFRVAGLLLTRCPAVIPAHTPHPSPRVCPSGQLSCRNPLRSFWADRPVARIRVKNSDTCLPLPAAAAGFQAARSGECVVPRKRPAVVLHLGHYPRRASACPSFMSGFLTPISEWPACCSQGARQLSQHIRHIHRREYARLANSYVGILYGSFWADRPVARIRVKNSDIPNHPWSLVPVGKVPRSHHLSCWPSASCPNILCPAALSQHTLTR